MISPEYCRLFARYNAWQNQSLIEAASSLKEEERCMDRGAYFGSIARTFNHLLWDDELWLLRFQGNERPEQTVRPTLNAPTQWTDFVALRREKDRKIVVWTQSLEGKDLCGLVSWYPGGGDTRIEKPRALCIAHFFNHQTHHRGQIHAMLTSAGATPEATDLPMLQ